MEEWDPTKKMIRPKISKCLLSTISALLFLVLINDLIHFEVLAQSQGCTNPDYPVIKYPDLEKYLSNPDDPRFLDRNTQFVLLEGGTFAYEKGRAISRAAFARIDNMLVKYGWAKVPQQEGEFSKKHDNSNCYIHFSRGAHCFTSEAYIPRNGEPTGTDTVTSYVVEFKDGWDEGTGSCDVSNSGPATGGGSSSGGGSSGGGTPSVCTIPYDEESQRQQIFNEIDSKYGFSVQDSNVCTQPRCNNEPLTNNAPWPLDTLKSIKNTLDALPNCFISKLRLSTIGGVIKDETVGDSERSFCCCQDKDGFCGYSGSYRPNSAKVTFCGDRYRAGYESNEKNFTGSLVHELTHAVQYFDAPNYKSVYDTPTVSSYMEKVGWVCSPALGCVYSGREPPLDDYSKVSPLEDMAQAARYYFANIPGTSPNLKEISPTRYEFVKNQLMCGHEYETNPDLAPAISTPQS